MEKKAKFKICLAQLNPIVGDIEYNTRKVIDTIQKHQGVDLIVFPEMFLVGYPLMDHIYDPIIQKNNKEAIENNNIYNKQKNIYYYTSNGDC